MVGSFLGSRAGGRLDRTGKLYVEKLTDINRDIKIELLIYTHVKFFNKLSDITFTFQPKSSFKPLKSTFSHFGTIFALYTNKATSAY